MFKDVLGTVDKITAGIKENTDIAVIGMSGGADSTLIATLCSIALGKNNVYGIHMPYDKGDVEKFNKNSQNVADFLEIKSIVYPIGKTADVYSEQYETLFSEEMSQLNFGNLKARLRANTLYAYCGKLGEEGKRARVIGTGNMSEDFIGYDTKGGDALADFFPIGSLFKSEVYQLLDYFIELGVLKEEMIDRTPSAGLWDGQTDEGELGFTYNEMEPAIRLIQARNRFGGNFIGYYFYKILEMKFCRNARRNETLGFVYRRYIENKHKHEAPYVLNIRS